MSCLDFSSNYFHKTVATKQIQIRKDEKEIWEYCQLFLGYNVTVSRTFLWFTKTGILVKVTHET